MSQKTQLYYKKEYFSYSDSGVLKYFYLDFGIWRVFSQNI